MPWIPTFNLYQSDGTTLVTAITKVQNINEDAQTYDSVVIDGLRGVGAVVIPGSAQAFNLTLDFVITASDYTNLMSAYSSLDTTIIPFTPYVLKIDTSVSTTKNFNVMRTGPILITNTLDGHRNTLLRCSLTLLANSW